MRARVIRMARRPDGVPVEEDFAFETLDLPAPADGEALVRLQAISLDPYIRLRMAGRHLVGNLSPGDMISSEMVGVVVESRSQSLRPGAMVAGFAPWCDLAVLRDSELRPLPAFDLPATLTLGILGMPGLTAYAGITRILQPGPEDVLVVSAAAGPVGATVGQLASLRGATVIGIAGGPKKCLWLKEVAGFSAAIDHRNGQVAEALLGLAPDGPTAYFDNVGGDLLRTVLGVLRPYGRIALCGIIADYNSNTRAPGPEPLEIISRRATLSGLVVYDHEDLSAEWEREGARLIRAGDLHYLEDITEGLDGAPTAFARLMRGENVGKSLVRLD
ncbi:MAG: NADP-dependent oxidoreductase [Thermaurantiacus sp.]